MQTNNFTDVQCRLSISVILDAKCKPATSTILGAKCKPATSMIFVSRHLQICSFAHVDCVLHGFSNFASFSLRFSLLLLLMAELGPRRGGIVPATGLATFLHLGFCLGSRLSSTANLHSHLLKGSLRSTTHLHRRGRPSHRVATQREEQEAQRGCRHNGHGNLHFYRNCSQSRRTAVTLYLLLLQEVNNA